MTIELKDLLPNYKPLPKLEEWHSAPQLEKGIKGGVRSGKTYSLMAEALLSAYTNRPYFHLSLSPSFDNACDTVVVVLEELCEKNGLEYKWIKSNRLFRFNLKDQKDDPANILIYGADMSFKGITAASGDINEPFSIPKRQIYIWWERISHPEAVRLVRLWGGTAEPDKMQWGWEYWEKKNIIDDRSYITTITTYDNKYLSDDYIVRLADKYDSRMREVYMLGKNINLSADRAYYAFDSEASVIPIPNSPLERGGSTAEPGRRGVLQQNNTLILGFDFNVDPMCAVEMIVEGDTRIQTDEYVIHSSNTGELCEFIIARLKEKYDGELDIIITGDASGHSKKSSSLGSTDYSIIKEYFDQSGYKVDYRPPRKNPPVRERINYANKMFETGKYLITRNCKLSIRDRGLVTWKQETDGFVIDKSRPDISHLSDAGDYALWASRSVENTSDGINAIETYGVQREYG
jgi:hypothetical protein